MEKIFANEATDKTPNKQTAHAVQYKKKIQSKNGWKINRHFSKKTYNGQTHEKMLNITIRQIQIKTIIRHHLTPARMAVIKKIYKQQVGFVENARQGLEKREPFHTVGRNVN